ncbi:putative reverse transcriptase zinc-binding domain-containing protein [Arabidopsis thaliana]
MEVLSRMLDSGLLEGKFSAHPLCITPRLTHLAFADDLLVFSDGSQHSLLGISGILQTFHSFSGLDMNPSKSELFFGGYGDSEAAVIADLIGIRIGVFPSRYLGLPLNPTKLSLATLQPFIQKITKQLNSWTTNELLESSLVLPKGFYKKIDNLCSAFLWKNTTSSARGARVAWKDICKTKEEGGLGIRSLEEFATVFRLKQVWHLFTRRGSLWVMWLDHNIFGRRNYWLMDSTPRLSWNIRKMLEVKSVFQRLIKCQMRDGMKASFWFDYWTSLGPLIELFGQLGPRELRISRNASVWEATHEGQWHFPNARSHQAEQLQICLSSVAPPSPLRGADWYQWKQPTGTFSETFSSKGTWMQIRQISPHVAWHKAVWFKESVPRFSFIHWMASHERLTTRDRLYSGFSRSLWISLAGRSSPNPPLSLPLASMWVLGVHSSPPHYASKILKLLLQTAVYMIWKERNRRVFSADATLSLRYKNSR